MQGQVFQTKCSAQTGQLQNKKPRHQKKESLATQGAPPQGVVLYTKDNQIGQGAVPPGACALLHGACARQQMRNAHKSSPPGEGAPLQNTSVLPTSPSLPTPPEKQDTAVLLLRAPDCEHATIHKKHMDTNPKVSPGRCVPHPCENLLERHKPTRQEGCT